MTGTPNRSTNKVREREYVVRFCATMRCHLEFSQLQNDPPDFQSYSSRFGRIALEVTHCMKEAARNRDIYIHQILRNAEAEAHRAGIPGRYVNVVFTDAEFTRGDQKRIPEYLVPQVAQFHVPRGERVTIPLDDRHVQEITVSNFGRQGHVWTEGVGALVQEEFSEHLRGIIAGKENDFPRYHGQYDAKWLLIVADFEHASGYFSPGDSMLPWTHPTKFDKVFFVEHLFDIVTELK